jgi:hypothetical protein
MHDRSYIARFQSFGGEIAFQNDSVMSRPDLPALAAVAAATAVRRIEHLSPGIMRVYTTMMRRRAA